MPGIVGMHDHIYYIARPNLDATGHGDEPLIVPQMTFSAPRLYLAAGSRRYAPPAASSPTPTSTSSMQIDAGICPARTLT